LVRSAQFAVVVEVNRRALAALDGEAPLASALSRPISRTIHGEDAVGAAGEARIQRTGAIAKLVLAGRAQLRLDQPAADLAIVTHLGADRGAQGFFIAPMDIQRARAPRSVKLSRPAAPRQTWRRPCPSCPKWLPGWSIYKISTPRGFNRHPRCAFNGIDGRNLQNCHVFHLIVLNQTPDITTLRRRIPHEIKGVHHAACNLSGVVRRHMPRTASVHRFNRDFHIKGTRTHRINTSVIHC
jgi:hypothetical protein